MTSHGPEIDALVKGAVAQVNRALAEMALSLGVPRRRMLIWTPTKGLRFAPRRDVGPGTYPSANGGEKA